MKSDRQRSEERYLKPGETFGNEQTEQMKKPSC